MRLTTMIIDDAPEARFLLNQFCSKNKQIDLVATFENAEKGLEFLKDNEVDLVLLDVEMPPGMSGIEFLNKAPIQPLVIFTSSNPNYAIDAFKFEAVDYLQKPFNVTKFNKAVDKAVQKFVVNQNGLTNMVEELPKSIFIKEKGRHIRLNTDDITYFENVSDYVRIHVGNEHYLIYSTLKGLAAKLSTKKFLRIHRSYIVNLDKIVDIEENTLVIGRTVIPIGKQHKTKLMRHLKTI